MQQLHEISQEPIFENWMKNGNESYKNILKDIWCQDERELCFFSLIHLKKKYLSHKLE